MSKNQSQTILSLQTNQKCSGNWTIWYKSTSKHEALVDVQSAQI